MAAVQRTDVIKIVGISSIFVVLTLLGTQLVQGSVTWLDTAIVLAVFITADAALVAYIARSQDTHAHTPKSTH